MPIPEMSPQQKYEQFCHTHPQYKNMSMKQVYSIMLKEKIINEAELAELKKPLFDFKQDFDNKSWSPKGYENMGLYIGSDQNKNKQKPANYVEVPKKYHPKFTELEMKDNKTVNMSAYSFENLQNKYNKDKYNVVKNSNNGIIVTDKKGQPVFKIFSNYFGSMIVFHDGKNESRIEINRKNEIDGYQLVTMKDGTKITKLYNKDSYFPRSVREDYPNGDSKNTNYDEKTGQIKFQNYWKKGGCMAEWIVEYSNGKPYKKEFNGKTEYPLVNDLDADITAKNALGLPTTRSSISENVLKRINYDNIDEILENYKKQTDRDLMQDIEDEIGLPPSLRNKLINHIEALYCKKAPAKESGEYLAQKLFDDIYGLGSGKLSQHVQMIDSNNIKYVLAQYKRLSHEKQGDMRVDAINLSNILYQVSFIDCDLGEISDKLYPIEGLLTAISNETGLKESVRKNLIKQIVDASLNEKSPEVQSRIRRDIASHPDDNHKIEVDIYRAENSRSGDFRTPESEKEKLDTQNNKTFSGQIKQGRTGDCWLLAGLNSIIAKPEMRKRLEKLVTFDSKSGDYIVNLKGIKKTYRITQTDLKEYTALSTGSEKVNAVEIAMDKLIRDESYEGRENLFFIDDNFEFINNVTIDGNFSSFLWECLFGINSQNRRIHVDPKDEDFNNPNRVYEMHLKAADKISINGLAKSEKEDNYSIISRHAYSIIGSDKNNIYLLNPWDSTDKITITRENFEKLGAGIECYEYPMMA